MNATIKDRIKMTATPTTGGGGSDVVITPTLLTGEKIADFEIDGESGSLYAPSQRLYSIFTRVIYQDTALGANPVNVPIPYIEDLSNYDMALVYYADSMDAFPFYGITIIPNKSPSELFYCGYGQRVNKTRFDNQSFTQTTVTAAGESGGYAPHVYQIIGVRLGVIV